MDDLLSLTYNFDQQKLVKKIIDKCLNGSINNTGETNHAELLTQIIVAAGSKDTKEAAKLVSLLLNKIVTENNRANAAEEAACTDPLTGLRTKNYMLLDLENRIAESIRKNCDISFIMIDVDKFKKINDTFGHLAGDEAIKYVVNNLSKYVRDSDIAARWGGDEFCIVCPETSLSGAKALATRISKAFSNSKYTYKGKTIKISVSAAAASIGKRTLQGLSHISSQELADKLIESADKRMYELKNGKNEIKNKKSLVI